MYRLPANLYRRRGRSHPYSPNYGRGWQSTYSRRPNNLDLNLEAHEPPSQFYRNVAQDYDNANRNGIILDVDRGRGETVPWQQPIRVYRTGTMCLLGARNYDNPIYHVKKPRCAHLFNPHRSEEDCQMVLVLNQVVPGAPPQSPRVDYWRCPFGHGDIFYSIIPRQTQSRVLSNQTELEEYMQEFGDPDWDEYGDELWENHGTFNPPSSSPKVSEPDHVKLDALTARRIPPPSNESSSSTPVSLFSKTNAMARAESDFMLVSNLNQDFRRGVTSAEYTNHPAYIEKGPSHPLLALFDPRAYPGCNDMLEEYSYKYFNTLLGRVVREFNSTLGIPAKAMETIRQCRVECSVCCCIFSPDGYYDHIKDHCCGNWPTKMPARRTERPATDFDEDDLPLRKYPAGTRGDDIRYKEFLDTPSGTAMMAWNSRVGIPKDVYHLIFTGYTRCPTCRLVRSLTGHHGHLKPDGTCADLGDCRAFMADGDGDEEA